MIEHALYATFLITFGMQIGRILTLQQQARKTVQGMEALYRSDWLAPAVMAARLHPDQEALPPVGPLKLSITQQCRIIHSSVRAR